MAMSFSLLRKQSIEKAIVDWRRWIEINEEFAPEGICWNPKWLPIAHNGGGDYVCIDLDSETGSVGRIIWARHEYIPEIEVIASNLRFWLEKFADELHAGVYEYYEGVYEKGLFTKEDLRWIREQEESYEKKRKTRQILASLYEVLPLDEQEEYQSQGALDLSHARSIIDGLPSDKQEEYLSGGIPLEEARSIIRQFCWYPAKPQILDS
jgi:hypothetical protein